MDKQYQTEVEEWGRVNKLLRQHGLPIVEPVHPDKSAIKSDLLMLDPNISHQLRESLKTLVRDCDRRQELIQELILTNNQLRDEIRSQTTLSEKYERKACDLKDMLDESKLRLHELEDDQLNSSTQQHEEDEKLRNTVAAARTKCKETQARSNLLQKEIERLQTKLHDINTQEQRRSDRQKEVFSQLRKKGPRGGIDDRTLDLIDWYEEQIHHLKRQLELSGIDIPEVKENKGEGVKSASVYDSTPSYKNLIRAYEKQLRDGKRKIKTLENEIEVVKLDLNTRPEVKDLRESQVRVRKLERLIKQKQQEHFYDLDKDERQYSTRCEDLEFVPASQCRHFLEVICTDLKVDNLRDISPRVETMLKSEEVQPKLKQVLLGIRQILEGRGAPRAPGITLPTPGQNQHELWCDRSLNHLLPTIQYWLVQLQAMKELQQSLRKLQSSLLPWQPDYFLGDMSMTEMIYAVDSMMKQESSSQVEGEMGRRQVADCSVVMLRGTVQHFMQLFDVTQVSGCYARMSDIYGRLGEVENMLKSLKNMLGLDRAAKSSAVVDATAQLCHIHNNTSYQQMKQLLNMEELDSILDKLHQYEEFFPVFHSLTEEIMEIVDVERLDQLVPEIRMLKLTSGS